MSQKEYSTKGRKFKHLNEYQRGEIEAMLKLKVSKAQIARESGIGKRYAAPGSQTVRSLSVDP